MEHILTQLSFDKPISVLLALIPALLNLFIIIYIAARMQRQPLARAFGFFTLALLLWQLDDVMARLSTNSTTFDAWNNLFSIGWIFFAPLGLYFTLLFTGKKELSNKLWFLLLCFIPALFFESVYKAHFFPHYYKYDDFWGWIEPHNMFVLDKVLIAWISVQVLIMLILMIQYSMGVIHQRHLKYQAIIVTLGMLLPAIQGLITQVIRPVIFNLDSIPITSSSLSLFSIATFVALNKYRLFSIESVDKELLIENLSDLLFTVSPDGRITYINSYGAALLEITAKDVSNLTFDKFLDKDELYRFKKEIIEPVLSGDIVDSKLFTFEINGKKMSVLCTSDVIYENNTIIGALVVARDITQVKIAEDEIRQKNIELERSNEELEQFAFVASHDLKEPLRMVSNYTQLLEKRYADQLDDTAKEYISYAVDGVHRMQDLINDLLTYSRIGNASKKFNLVDCNVILQQVFRNLQAIIIESGATIEYDKLPTIKASKTQIAQLFQNLLENAIKFKASDRKPQIMIKCEKTDDRCWLFSVSDNGIGIKTEYQEKVFVLFQRLHQRNAYPGTGIGLAMCKKIVNLYNGKIWFESIEGEGSTFYFTLQA